MASTFDSEVEFLRVQDAAGRFIGGIKEFARTLTGLQVSLEQDITVAFTVPGDNLLSIFCRERPVYATRTTHDGYSVDEEQVEVTETSRLETRKLLVTIDTAGGIRLGINDDIDSGVTTSLNVGSAALFDNYTCEIEQTLPQDL